MFENTKERLLWKAMHEELGCYECRYADKEVLGKQGCCTFPGRLENDENGKCLKAKPKKKP